MWAGSGLVFSMLIGQVGCERGTCSVWAGPGLISGDLIAQVSVGEVRVNFWCPDCTGQCGQGQGLS